MRKQFPLFSAVFLFAATTQGAPSTATRLQHLPPEVRKTISIQLGEDGKLGRIARSKEDGKPVFEVTIKRDGKSRDFTIARNGSVLEKEVFLEEVPPSVRKTILETTHGAEIDDISETAEDGEVDYEVEIVKGQSDQDFTVGRNGKLLSVEVTLAETPASVQKTIKEKTAGATNVEIDKTTDGGEDNYDVTMTKEGVEQNFSVSSNGEFLGTDIDLNQAPAVVRKTILAEAAGGKIGDLTTTTDEEGAYYEAEITDGKGTRYATVNADGTLDSTERPIALSEAPSAVQSAITLQGGKVVDVSRVTEDGEVTYEIEITKGGGDQELNLTPDGKPAAP